MPLRLGKTMRKVLKRMAENQRQGIHVDFADRGLTTIEHKAIRQLIREHHLANWRVPNMTTGPERTPLRPLTSEQVDAYKRMRLAGVEPELEPVANISTAAAIKAAKSGNLV